MNRRQFLRAAVGAAAAVGVGQSMATEVEAQLPAPSAGKLPRWRGFNLLNKYIAEHSQPFDEADFALISEWGFDFARLPLSYRCWTEADDWLKLRESALLELDRAVEFGRLHGVHVNLNLHRAPGYCVNPPKELLSLWTDAAALDACTFHWTHLADRYKGIPSSRMSFNLLNEPGDIPLDQYVRVIRHLADAVRAVDPDRLIIADGLKWGTVPLPMLAENKIAQSTHGYAPMHVTHYHAGWVHGADQWPVPTWPLDVTTVDQNGVSHVDHWDKARLFHMEIEPWKKLEAMGIGIHVGEWGAHNQTPHDVVLAWMTDRLAQWRDAGWGWSLWNLRGSFGVLDSGRADVKYESFRGHQLDRGMLELLRES